MAMIWWDNDTFAHGMVVLPISLWLIWQQRDRLKEAQPVITLNPLALLLLLGLVWLLGELAQIAVLRMGAAVGMLIVSVVAGLGWAVAWRLAFPILFLLFAVPFGDFLIEPMMDQTADVVVASLQFLGIPVHRTGRNFAIPTGNWAVVEACSGLRYLIASIMLGTLFAYLYFRQIKKRLIFIAVAILVPVVANWIRATLIVLVGHWSENKYATGIDHIISGWVFFGLVIFIMFWIGGKFQDDMRGEPQTSPIQTDVAPRSAHKMAPFLLLCLLFGAVFPYLLWPLINKPYDQTIALTAPRQLGQWTMSSQPAWQPEYRHEREKLNQRYVLNHDESIFVDVYLAGYRNQAKYGSMITYANRLMDFWDASKGQSQRRIIHSSIGAVEENILPANKQSTSRRVVWRQFQVGSHTHTELRAAKIDTLFHQLRLQGDASSVLMLATVDDEANRASERITLFMAAAAKDLQALQGRLALGE
jgi:exosortase A